MLVAVTDTGTIIITLAGLVAVLALLALVRMLLRREPSPPHWLRYRLGVFVERDPSDEPYDDDEYDDGSGDETLLRPPR